MVKVFFVKDSGMSMIEHVWKCETCRSRFPLEYSKSFIIKQLGRIEAANTPPSNKEIPEPVTCEVCGYSAEFFCRRYVPIYIRQDTGEEIVNLSDHPGACYEDPKGAWDSTHRTHRFGPDGRALVLVCPDKFHWYIDSRASNCDRKDDFEHRCWCRKGSPEEPGTLHVDKSGLTCGAGAGSIATGRYHGFCHNGELTDHLG